MKMIVDMNGVDSHKSKKKLLFIFRKKSVKFSQFEHTWK